MHIRKLVAALLLASSSWLVAAKTIGWEWSRDFNPMVKYNASKLDKGELECLRSSQTSLGTRFKFKFKGYCEDAEGQCFWARMIYHARIVDNWQCWKRDDGWWQADFTLLGF
ncbi:unnamed protein product [Clonostachys solani]|uniref:Uncharacterized protein n=1 Tax=Clonostachys solani TaxID=160281 RepID=A0A9N9ZIR4_9HYPO|nr:unnamed protein product [Clonostachys solani]